MKSILVSIALVLSAATAQAGARNFNIRYGFMTGPMLELGFSKFGIGVSAPDSATSSGTDGVLVYSAKASIIKGRFSVYSAGMGTDSWYGAVDVGTLKAEVTGTNNSSTAVTGEGSSSYTGFQVGYHWFWSNFNMHAGFGSISAAVPAVEVKDSNGAVVNQTSELKFSLPALDLGLGIAF